MRLLYRGLLFLIIIGTWGCERPPKELTPEDLPIAHGRSFGEIDFGSPRFIVHVITSNCFVVASSPFVTNATGISSITLRRYASRGHFPFFIWAKKEALFEDVWCVMELGATNRYFRLVTREADSPKRKITVLPRFDQSSDEKLNFFGCFHFRYLESASNLVIVACDKYRLTLNNTPCSIEDLKTKLNRIKHATPGMLHVLILATGDCSYQQVINVVDASDEGAIYLGLQRPGAPLPELPREEKNE